jgi:cell division protein FtsI/penicillin-binding protein 2
LILLKYGYNFSLAIKLICLMKPSFRISIIVVFYLFTAFAIVFRLFHWQIVSGNQLAILASSQRGSVASINPVRGNILASDGFPLAINQEAYLVYGNPQEIELSANALAQMLSPYLVTNLNQVKIATDASEADIDEIKDDLKDSSENLITSQMSQSNLVWALLKNKVNKQTKEEIEQLQIKGIHFQTVPDRIYPEASMAAHILGFVGQDEKGKDIGYFGLEGFYDMDLIGRIGIVKQEKDAINRPIPIGRFWSQKKRDGRHLQLFLNRGIQFLVEEELKQAVKKYGAKSGSVLIMDPKTGGIIAMASIPSFEPGNYSKYDYGDFVNPLVSRSYEPGSTFKILTMAAGIDTGSVKPDTKCDICHQQFKIDKYFIKTWNDKYYKDSTMTDVLVHSDNVGMVFVAKKLGIDKFVKYIKDFGIGEKTGIDLQGEIAPALRENWIEVDLYTAAFGQGLSITGIQMVKAVGAIANQGKLVQPRMVNNIIDSDRELQVPTKVISQVVSEKTAKTITDMLVAAVDYGDAKWAKPKGYKIAGKTGTAQIAIGGHYDEEKTIASFVGFAPADDPAFVMLTIIEEPQSSPWGSETAAPLFFDIAKKLFIYLGISPEK